MNHHFTSRKLEFGVPCHIQGSLEQYSLWILSTVTTTFKTSCTHCLVSSRKMNLIEVICNKMVQLHTHKMQPWIFWEKPFRIELSPFGHHDVSIWCSLIFIYGESWKEGMVYENNQKTIDKLKTVITDAISSISQHEIGQVFDNKIRHVEKCLQATGHHFQYFL
jgi:hypothetical protein